MKTWKKAVLGLVAAAGIAGGTGVAINSHKRQVRLEDLCEQNGVKLENGKDPRQSLIEQGFIYEPKYFWELSSEPRCFLKLVGKEDDVLIGTSYGNPFLVDINGIGVCDSWGLTTNDGKRSIVDEFPIKYSAILSSGPCEEQKGEVERMLLCDFFKGYLGTTKDRVDKLFDELKRITVAHEKQHSEDILGGKSYSGLELEMRAYLKGIMISPMGFLLLENNDPVMQFIAKKTYEIFDHYSYKKDGSNRGMAWGLDKKEEVVRKPHDKVTEHIKEYIANVYGESW